MIPMGIDPTALSLPAWLLLVLAAFGIGITKSGFSARIVASHRPAVPILALTDEARTCRQLNLVWGVVPRLVPPARGYDHMLAMALEQALQLGLVERGDRVLVTAGVPFDVPGTTNFMKVETV